MSSESGTFKTFKIVEVRREAAANRKAAAEVSDQSRQTTASMARRTYVLAPPTICRSAALPNQRPRRPAAWWKATPTPSLAWRRWAANVHSYTFLFSAVELYRLLFPPNAALYVQSGWRLDYFDVYQGPVVLSPVVRGREVLRQCANCYGCLVRPLSPRSWTAGAARCSWSASGTPGAPWSGTGPGATGTRL